MYCTSIPDNISCETCIAQASRILLHVRHALHKHPGYYYMWDMHCTSIPDNITCETCNAQASPIVLHVRHALHKHPGYYCMWDMQCTSIPDPQSNTTHKLKACCCCSVGHPSSMFTLTCWHSSGIPNLQIGWVCRLSEHKPADILVAFLTCK
jgi:hypothetical protein